MKNESAKKLLDFMKKSPTRYQVVANFEAMLNEKGYEKLYTEKPWRLGARGQILCFAQRIEHNGVPHPRRTHRGLYAFRRAQRLTNL